MWAYDKLVATQLLKDDSIKANAVKLVERIKMPKREGGELG